MTKATIVRIFCLTFLIGYISASKHPKIIGGSNAVIKEFPYLVSMSYNGEHNCGGSIISDRHILTAAHCLYDIDENDKANYTIRSGTSSPSKEGIEHKIKSFHLHPNFNMTNDEGGYPDDIAVLTLEEPIVFNKHQQKINLPSHDVPDYQTAYVVGWGMTSSKHGKFANPLHKLKVALVPYDTCKSILRHKMNPGQVCAFRSPKTGACHGDSGGPLVSHGEVVGIVSYGDTGKCADSAPDIYTNVFAYKDFIASIMNENF